MKLRIHDGTFRFRVTGEEVDHLQETGAIVSENRLPAETSNAKTFTFEVRKELDAETSRLELVPYGMTLLLSAGHLNQLQETDQEGIYIERHWTDDQGNPRYTLVFIEKDRRP